MVINRAQTIIKKGVTVQNRNPLNYLWWRRGDLNSRPPPCEGDALPAELLPHMDATTRRSEVCMPFTCRGQVFFASSRPSARREELNAATGTGQATTKLAPQGGMACVYAIPPKMGVGALCPCLSIAPFFLTRSLLGMQTGKLQLSRTPAGKQGRSESGQHTNA